MSPVRQFTPEELLRGRMRRVAEDAAREHRAWQNVPELAEVLYLVASEYPTAAVIVEIGSAWGGTLYAWRNLPSQPAVFGITQEHFGLPERSYGATVLVGDSHDPVTLQRLKDQIGGRPVDVLFIDGDHSEAGAYADWVMYSPLVRPGGLVLFHDIACAGVEDVGVVWGRVRAEVENSGGYTTEIIARAGKPLGFGVVRMAGDV